MTAARRVAAAVAGQVQRRRRAGVGAGAAARGVHSVAADVPSDGPSTSSGSVGRACRGRCRPGGGRSRGVLSIAASARRGPRRRTSVGGAEVGTESPVGAPDQFGRCAARSASRSRAAATVGAPSVSASTCSPVEQLGGLRRGDDACGGPGCARAGHSACQRAVGALVDRWRRGEVQLAASGGGGSAARRIRTRQDRVVLVRHRRGAAAAPRLGELADLGPAPA